MAESKKTIAEKLTGLQNDLKVTKNLHNSFGNYNYRNAESIFEAVKPLLSAYKLSLVVSDEIIAVSDRVYVKAIATLKDTESEETISAVAYAREAATKKGMDDSQVTGATSSYARKYALSGLFLLDDNKDADSDEYQKQTKVKEKNYDTMSPRKALKEFCEDNGLDIRAICQTCSITNNSSDQEFKDALKYSRGLVR